MADSMVERVAAALKRAFADEADRVIDDEEAAMLALAAMKAMREPTQAMCLVDGPGNNHRYEDVESRAKWQKMIDAALGEAEGSTDG